MQLLYKLSFISLVLSLMYGCSFLATQDTLNVAAIENADIRNLKHPESTVFSSGQPTQEQLRTLGAAGIKHVVNLRPASELDWNEQKHVVSLDGVTYHNIPIEGADDVSAINAAALHSLLQSFGNEPVLVHCGSSNRVGALMAVSEAQQNGADTDAAVEEGKRWGLTRLEPVVRSVLSK